MPAKKIKPTTEEEITKTVEGIPGVVKGSVEQYKPMGVPEPSLEDRIEALEIRQAVTEAWTTKHNKYHFGGTSKG